MTDYDDEYGRRLLSPLATEPPPATRIDVAGAMRLGRRSRRTRIWSLISGASAVLAAGATGIALTAPAGKPEPDLPIDPPIPVACTATRLSAGGVPEASVTGGDPSGTWLVGTTYPNYGPQQRTVLVWRDGRLVDSVLQTGRPGVMTDINASGVAVGSTTESPVLPFVYRNGKVSRLAGAGSADVVNGAGMIAGTREVAYVNYPVRWAGPDAQPEVMKLPAGTLGGKTMDIAEDGTIAVRVSTRTEREQTYLWLPDGSVRPIGSPKVAHGQARFAAGFFRSGWLYGIVAIVDPEGTASSGPPSFAVPAASGPLKFDPPRTPAYRYHVASGTWQKLPDIAEFDLGMSSATLERFVGRQLFSYPEPATTGADDDFEITFVSEDGRTAGGRSLSKRADPAHRDQPYRWRCR